MLRGRRGNAGRIHEPLQRFNCVKGHWRFRCCGRKGGQTGRA
jgi:hypothetical protein